MILSWDDEEVCIRLKANLEEDNNVKNTISFFTKK